MADVVYSLTINGIERDNLLASVSLRTTNGNVSTLDFAVDSEDASYRPEIDDVVIFSENGTPKFKGAITSARESCHGGPALDSIVTECSAASQEVILTYRFVTITIPSGSTLKQAITQIDADPEAYFSGYGITVAAGQADGPTLASDVTFTDTRLDAVIVRLAELTGYIPEVSSDDEFEMYAPGSRSAPGDLLATGAVHQVGDVTIEPTKNDTYINRIKLKITGAGPATSTETITFDGNAVFEYVANYPAPTNANTTWPNVIYLASDLGERGGPIGFNDGSSAWEWITAENTRARLSLNGAGLVPANGDTFVITYDIAYPFTVTREALGSPPAPIREIILTQPEGMTMEEAIAYADSLLDRKSTVLKTAKWDSYTLGWAPGQSLTINLPKRNTNATFLITDVVMRPEVTTDENGDVVKFRYEVTALEGDIDQGNWRETPKSWLGAGNTQAGTVDVSAGGGARPGGDIYDVQTHGPSHDFYGSGYVKEDFDLGGDAYGTNQLTSRLAVKATNHTQTILALVNAALTDANDKALTFTQLADGNVLIELESGGSFSINTYGSGSPRINLSSAENIVFEPNNKLVNYVRTRGLSVHDTFGLADDSFTSTYTMDSSGGPYTLLRFRGSSDTTVNLIAIAAAAARIATLYCRLIAVVHDGSAGTLTLDPNSTETIGNGTAAASTIGLTSGQSVLLALVSGTGGGVKLLASHGGVGLTTVTPGGSDTYVQYNDGGAFGGDSKLTFNETTGAVQITRVAGAGGDGKDMLVVKENGTASPGTPIGHVTIEAGSGTYQQVGLGMRDYAATDELPAYLAKQNTAAGFQGAYLEVLPDETVGSALDYSEGVGISIEHGGSTDPNVFEVYEYGGLGTGAVAGMAAKVKRNSSGSGAAGTLGLEDRDGDPQFLWFHEGQWYYGDARPTEDDSVDHVGTPLGVTGVGTYGLLVEDGATAPPVTLYLEDGTDWLYADGPP